MWRDPFDVDNPGYVMMCDPAGPHRDYSSVWCQLCKASWKLDDGDKHEPGCTYADWHTHVVRLLHDRRRCRLAASLGREIKTWKPTPPRTAEHQRACTGDEGRHRLTRLTSTDLLFLRKDPDVEFDPDDETIEKYFPINQE